MTFNHDVGGSIPLPQLQTVKLDYLNAESGCQERSRPCAYPAARVPGRYQPLPADRQTAPVLCGVQDTGFGDPPADLLSGRMIA